MLMRFLLLTLLTPVVSGCANEIPKVDEKPPAICDGSRAARADHAKALAETEDEKVLLTGARLIDMLDAGCAAST